MAEGTRWKITEDKLTRHDEMLADLLNSQEEVRHTQTGIQGTLDLILERLGVLERAQVVSNVGAGLLPIPNVDNRNRAQPNAVTLPRWELPYFAIRNRRCGSESVIDFLHSTEWVMNRG